MTQQGSQLGFTTFEGQTIACFNVGGELRLCLPHILNRVLGHVPVEAVYQACGELQINISNCSQSQLQALNNAGIFEVDVTARRVGLISESDAERLCTRYLLLLNY